MNIALAPPADVDKVDNITSEFIRNEVRDKIAEIGTMLGFKPATERKVAAGAVVDAIWEATIGNMGRVIYDDPLGAEVVLGIGCAGNAVLDDYVLGLHCLESSVCP